MSRLSDRISEAVDAAREGGRVIVHDVATALLPSLTDDEREQAALEGLAARIKAAAIRGKAEVLSSMGSGQRELPLDLPRSFPIDLEGRQIKLTRDLNRPEVVRVIAIREASVAADIQALNKLRRAYAFSAPIWDQHPDWSFGQVLDAATAAEAAA